MKKAFIWIGIISLTLVILVKSGVLEALMIFLLVGAIPGTLHSVPPIVMLGIIATIVWLLTFRFTAISIIQELRLRNQVQQRTRQAKRMPKRRFGQI